MVLPSERQNYDQMLDDLRSGLDAETMNRAWQQGRSMSLKEAIAYALEQRA